MVNVIQCSFEHRNKGLFIWTEVVSVAEKTFRQVK